ncbi:MAG: methyltransferase domain-containing protein [Anaerolineae bacterium]|nr:methyltransferase domain-containing protein [Anaerolineae bacterium]
MTRLTRRPRRGPSFVGKPPRATADSAPPSEYDAFAAVYDFEYDELVEDIPFYRDLATEAGGPVLELGAGTGRVLIPVAAAGVEIVGLDASPAMLAVAREKVAGLPPDVQARISLVEGDMRSFDLGEARFGLVYIPFRAFLHMLTVEDQLSALAAIWRSLRPGGRLALAFFDPRLDLIAARTTARATTPFIERVTPLLDGARVVQWAAPRYDPLRQILDAEFIYDRLDADGRLVERVHRHLMLRWIYRYEAEHLFARAGFTTEALYGGFDGRPFESEGDEQVWVLRRPESRA